MFCFVFAGGPVDIYLPVGVQPEKTDYYIPEAVAVPVPEAVAVSRSPPCRHESASHEAFLMHNDGTVVSPCPSVCDETEWYTCIVCGPACDIFGKPTVCAACHMSREKWEQYYFYDE